MPHGDPQANYRQALLLESRCFAAAGWGNRLGAESPSVPGQSDVLSAALLVCEQCSGPYLCPFGY